MERLALSIKNTNKILALGPESDGNFSLYVNGELDYYSGYGDLLADNNIVNFKKELLHVLRKNNPDIILTDFHPLFKTTVLGQELAEKFKAQLIKVQHHHAHIFASVIDKLVEDNRQPKEFIAIAADGTGLGLDEQIWGGEVFQGKINLPSLKLRQAGNFQSTIKRVGSLEPQVMIGGDLAIKEPARMLLSLLLKKDHPSTRLRMKSFFSPQELNVLAKQYQQNFNCQLTTSAGRILDAVSVLLGFANNQREYKHQPIELLAKNSTQPYELEPRIEFDQEKDRYLISTSYLFDCLLKNLDQDKSRLAATAQLYLAQGFWQVISNCHPEPSRRRQLPLFFSGGLAKNKIMSEFLKNKGVYLNQKIPCGDAGISIGQIGYYLLANPRD